MPNNNQFNMTEHVKMVMESALSLIDESASGTGVFSCGNLSEITRLELFQFVAYLSASDDAVQQTETDFLNRVFGENLNPDTLAAYLKNNSIRNGEFEKMIPFTLEILIQVDAVLASQKKGWRGNMSELLISLYELLGEVFIESVPHTEVWEEFDLLAYVSFLKSFIHENMTDFNSASVVYKEDVIDELLSPSDGFIISSKKEDLGIIAPKKL